MTDTPIYPPLTGLFEPISSEPSASLYYVETAVPGMRILAGKSADIHRIFDTHQLYNQLVGGNAIAMSVCRVLNLEEQYFQAALGGSQPKSHESRAVACLYDIITLMVLKAGHLLSQRDYSCGKAWDAACQGLINSDIGKAAVDYAGSDIKSVAMLFAPTGGVFRNPAAVKFTPVTGNSFVLYFSDLIRHSMSWREEAASAHEALVEWTKACQKAYTNAIEDAAASEINIIIAAAQQAKDDMVDWPADYPLYRPKAKAK